MLSITGIGKIARDHTRDTDERIQHGVQVLRAQHSVNREGRYALGVKSIKLEYHGGACAGPVFDRYKLRRVSGEYLIALLLVNSADGEVFVNPRHRVEPSAISPRIDQRGTSSRELVVRAKVVLVDQIRHRPLGAESD